MKVSIKKHCIEWEDRFNKDINGRMLKAAGKDKKDTANVTFDRQNTLDDFRQETELYEAILSRNLEKVRRLALMGGKNIMNAADRDGWSSIHYAIWSFARTKSLVGKADLFLPEDAQKSKEIFKHLVNHGANVQAPNSSGVTPLHLAAWYGIDEFVELLLDRKVKVDAKADDSYKLHWSVTRQSESKTLFGRDCDLYRPDSFVVGNGITPLYLAARAGHGVIAAKLIAAGADVNSTKSYGMHQGITPLHAAAARGNKKAVQALLLAGCDVNYQASDGGTALHCACEFGHVDIAEEILNHKVNGKRMVQVSVGKTCVEADKITPLHLAATTGNAAIVQLLVNAGCDVNAQASDGFTAIHLASQNGSTEVVKILLETPRCSLDRYAYLEGCADLTPLHLAVRAGNLSIIDMLMAAGANIHAKATVSDIEGVSMIHLAAVCDHPSVIRKLIKLGCDVNLRTSSGSSALFLAVKESNADVVQVLLESKADLKLPDNLATGASMLHMAILGNNDLIVRMLIRAGCNVNEPAASDGDGLITPLYLAVDNKFKAIAKVLLENGADVNVELKNGFTVLHTASEQGFADIVQLLIEHNAIIDKAADFGELSNVTPLHLAVMNKYLVVAKVLANAGASLNVAKVFKGVGGFTPLYIAVKNQDEEMVSTLIACGCDVNVGRADGWSALHAAAEQGFIKIVQKLLDAKANPNAKADFEDNVGVLPIHQAAQEGHTEIVKILATAGNSVNAGKQWRDERGVTPLHLACEAGHLKTVEALIQLNADVNAKKSNGWTPLHWAAQNNHQGIVKILLANKADVNVPASFDEHKDCLPIHQASQHGHTPILRMLIEAGANVNATKTQGKVSSITSLHLASALGHADAVRLLIEHGAKFEALDQCGFSALHFACQNGHLDVVRTLLGAKCSVLHAANADGSVGILPIHQAAQSGHAAILKFLVLAGSPVDAGKRFKGRGQIQPIHLAAENGHVKACHALKELGADLNSMDEVGFTPLHLACKGDHADVAQYLLQNGANPNRGVRFMDAENVLPIHIAAQFDSKQALKKLLQHGVDLNASQKFNEILGLTALHLAAAEDHPSVVRALVTAGADVNLQNSEGKTAYDIAKSEGIRDVVKILRAAKIDQNLEA